MECREYRKLIQPFLKNSLDERKTKELLKHIDECPACYEEMRTEYLVVEGLKRLESGQNFDLNTEFDLMLEETGRSNRRIFMANYLVAGVFTAMLLFTLFVLIVGVF